jgi:DNA-binding transcriptional MerR regulator
MGELSRLSGVPSSTIKHYLREALLPGKSVSLAKNSALYDRSLVAQIRHIKDLQTTHFLPLWRIKEVLSGKADAAMATVAAAVDRVVEREASGRTERVMALLQRGLTTDELSFLLEHGLIASGEVMSGDDLALCEVIIRAHEAGLTDGLSTLTVLQRYQQHVERLVAAEIDIFQGIVAGAGDALATATVESMKVSERLVTLMRRRMLLPIFQAIVSEDATKAKNRVTTTGAPAGLARHAKAKTVTEKEAMKGKQKQQRSEPAAALPSSPMQRRRRRPQ